MSDLVESVARAICVASGSDPDFNYDPNGLYRTDDLRWRLFIPQARAAISAMREPTPYMSARACNALKRHIDSFSEEERVERWPGRKDDNGWRVPNKEKHRVRYQAMIDAALGVSVPSQNEGG